MSEFTGNHPRMGQVFLRLEGRQNKASFGKMIQIYKKKLTFTKYKNNTN